MGIRRAVTGTLLIGALAGGAGAAGVTGVILDAGQAAGAAQQGSGQTPSPLPLSYSVRERGSSVTPALEGWYYDKDGTTRLLIGYFNRNTKQELDLPIGANNHIDPGGPDLGQPTHFLTGRQYGVFTIKVPKDFGTKKLTWTLVSNGQTNTITLHTKPDYVVEPFEDPANKNTPPVIRFQADGPTFTGPPVGIAATYTTILPNPLTITTWMTDEGPKINIPEPSSNRGRGRGRGGADAGAAAGFTPPPPMSLTWSWFRGPAAMKFDNPKPPVTKENDGKASVTVTFTEPGEYILRAQANDSTGDGGGGFQCCWTNAHVRVTVKPAAPTGQ
jgi:hypothetical protein